MSAKTSARPKLQKTPTVTVSTIDSARNGSLQDLQHLAESVRAIPTPLLFDVLDVFLGCIEDCRIAENDMLSDMDSIYLHGLPSMVGIMEIIKLNEFKTKTIYAQRLFDAWSEVAKTLFVFYNDAKTHYLGGLDVPNGVGIHVARFVTQVLEALMLLDQRALAIVLDTEHSHALIFSIWLHEWREEYVTGESANLLMLCLDGADERIWSRFIEVTAEPAPQTIGKLAMKRLKDVLKKPAVERLQDQYLTSHSAIVHIVAHHPNARFIQALLANGALSRMMRVLNMIADASVKSRSNLFNAVICFSFLNLTFDTSMKCFVKALRKGFLRALAQLGPYIEKMDKAATALEAINNILEKVIPRYSVVAKVIRTLYSAMKCLSTEDREAIRNSKFGKDWNNSEILLMERLSVFRMDVIGDRMRRCEGVRVYVIFQQWYTYR